MIVLSYVAPKQDLCRINLAPKQDLCRINFPQKLWRGLSSHSLCVTVLHSSAGRELQHFWYASCFCCGARRV